MRLNSSLKSFFALYFTALIFCVGARIWLKLNAMDASTGFYIGNDGLVSALVWGFNTVLGVYVAALFLFYLLRRTERDYPVMRSDRLIAFFALLTGVAGALYQLETLGVTRFVTDSPGVEMSGITLIISVVLGAFTALAFIFMGLRTLFGRGYMHGGVLSLIGGVWMMLTMVFKFNSYTTLTTISDNLLAVLFMLFCALFMAGHARTLVGIGRKDGRNYTIPSGLSSSLFGILLVVPNWIWVFANGASALPAPMLGTYESVFVFFMSIYSLLFVRHICLTIRSV